MRGLLVTFIILFLGHLLLAQQTARPVALQRPSDYEYLSAPDSSGNRKPLKVALVNRLQELKLPYPIIFVHGLNSNSTTWDSTTNWMEAQYGLSFGGRFDFCLNYDADYYVANKNFNDSNADMALFVSNIVAGDYYYVNFDVSTEGLVSPGYWDNGFVRSNQSAIAKQGVAVKWAVERVLQETGRDKVILMGHSMGGLASREYLQNPENWQADGRTHVAKLVTTGTPHGGSNSTAYNLGFLVGLDEETEAVRDLRRSYYYSEDSGVFLYGGREEMTDSTMDDNLGVDFYNVDVNCDGVTGQDIVGLNEKSLHKDWDFAGIVGNCDGCWAEDGGVGDGVVNTYCANLNNFYPELNAETFYYNAPAYAEIHTVLPGLNSENMLGLDEPDKFELAYKIEVNKNYTGFITMQAVEPLGYDYDYFKFTMPYTGTVTITLNNIQHPELTIALFDSVFTSPGFVVQEFGNAQLTLSEPLMRGDYFLRVSAIAGPESYLGSYDFIVETNLLSSVSHTGNKRDAIHIYPNPATWELSIDTKDVSKISEIEVITSLGEVIYKTSEIETITRINVADFPEGMYILKLVSDNNVISKKFIRSE
ncbi:MAG: alpha/beta fold hydrolase [Bacteroidia bacterium]